MSAEPMYITPHETALAVIATSMKKSRLTLQTLVINSVLGGLLFSAGGMLFCCVHGNNPSLAVNNPGILDMLGGMNYSVGLFYVIINGCDMFNSNILFFTVGWLRGAVSIFDLLISWTVSWVCNLGGSLFVAYVICHLSGVMEDDYLKAGTVAIAEGKISFTFIQVFIKGIAGNFFVSLAVYLQLMSKPIHVKFLSILLPIYTFVACGFSHAVAEMFLMPTGMLNGANISVGKFIWKNLVPVTLGNIVGGAAFSLIVPFYLHLYVVEADRKQLSLPEYDAVDEQPELNVDSRVVQVNSKRLDGEYDEKRSSSDSLNPPGVFPIRGMKPLIREKTIMNSDYAAAAKSTYYPDDAKYVDDLGGYNQASLRGMVPEPYFADDLHSNNDSVDPQQVEQLPDDRVSNTDSLDLENQNLNIRQAMLKKIKTRVQKEQESFDETGRFNPEKNKLGAKLERMFTKGTQISSSKTHTVDNHYQQGQKQEPESAPKYALNNKNALVDASRRSSLVSSRTSLSTKAGIKRELQKQNVTNKALLMADPVAGSVDLDGLFVRKPSRLRKFHVFHPHRHNYDSDHLEEQSIGD